MQAYRQAAKLVPDIEFRAYKLQQQRYQQQQRQALVRGHRLRSKHTLKHVTLTCCAAAHYTASASSKTNTASPPLCSQPFSFHSSPYPFLHIRMWRMPGMVMWRCGTPRRMTRWRTLSRAFPA